MSELSELFDMDPRKHSEQDLLKIIQHLRQSQAQHELGPVAKPKAAPKTTKAEAILKDLGLS